MRVGATEAERIDARHPRAIGLRKRLQRGRHAELQGNKVDIRIGLLKMQTGGNAAVLEHKERLDQTGDACGSFQDGRGSSSPTQ